VISVVIPTLNDEAVLGRVLQPLVPAAVAGLVREVIIADGGSTDATLEIGDDAGCTILSGAGTAEARIRAAAGAAKGPWVMIVQPHAQLLPGWEAPAREHIELGTAQPAFVPLIDPDAGFLKRLAGLAAAKLAPVLLAPKTAFAGGQPRGGRRLNASALLVRA
jgi:glycosyltransferase involved in cell wall biosynthesis